MIPVTIKIDMVQLLGRAARWEEATDSWDGLSFEEKMEIAGNILSDAVNRVRGGTCPCHKEVKVLRDH